jgi:autotransporter-associated beta strand protein
MLCRPTPSNGQRFIAGLLVLTQLFWLPDSVAATRYWDADENATGNSVDGTGLGGAGFWTNGGNGWWDPLTGMTTWSNAGNDQAIFTGPASSLPTVNQVFLGTPITAGSLSFLRGGYTLFGGDLTLAGPGAGVWVNLGESATINSLIAGTDGFVKTGGGALRLGNAGNTYTGTTTISNGTLVVESNGALGSDTSTVTVTGAVSSAPGTLLLAGGYSTGINLARNLSISGGGSGGGVTGLALNGVALVSVGNNTLSGQLTSVPGVGTTNTGLTSAFGTLTVGNVAAGGTATTNFTTFGSTGSIGNYIINGALTGTGSIQRSGIGTLILNPSSSAGFTGTIRTNTGGSIRISSGSNLGANAGTGSSSLIDLNGGLLEVRSPVLNNVIGKNVYNRASSTIFVGPSEGGSALNGTATFGSLQQAINTSTTFNSRNGFGLTFSSMAIDASTSSSTQTNTLTNNMGGNLTFTGNITLGEGNTASRPRVLSIGGTGNTVIQGSVIAGTDTGKTLTKSAAGSLTILGVGTTVAGAVNIQGGAIIATDFRSLNNNSSAILLGNATTTAGNLIIGTSVAPTAAGLTTSKAITLNTTTASNSIYASQSGSNPIILNGAITKIGAATTGSLILGGTNTADNIVNSIIPVEPTPSTGGVVKLGSGTWVLAGANTYAGATTIQEGTLKLRATAAASDVIKEAASNTIVFSADGTTQTAGGTLEYRGFLNAATTETLGALTPTAGAARIVTQANGSGSAALTFTSLGTRGAGAAVNYAPGANTSVAFTTLPTVTNGILGAASVSAFQTFNGVDWATLSGSNVVQFTGYTVNAMPASGTAGSAVNYSQSTNHATTGTATINTLKVVGGASNPTITLGGVLTLSARAILFDNSSGTGTITGSQLGANATEVHIITNGSSPANALTVNSLIGGTTGSFTKSGSGTLIVGGNNTFTGNAIINEGIVRLSGATATLGVNSTVGNITTLRQGAVLDINAAGVSQTVGIGALAGAGTITNSGGGTNAAGTISLGTSTSTGTTVFSGVLQDGDGILNVRVDGTTARTQSLMGLSTYTGVTSILTGAQVTVDVLGNGGVASGIGASTNAASNLVFNGTAPTLIYRGNLRQGSLNLGSASATTDRLFTVLGSSAIISSTVSNNNAIVWSNTGALAFGGTESAKTLTLTGSSTGDNWFYPQITDSGTGANFTSLTKASTGLWILGNTNNTYTGATTVSNGTLAIGALGALPANSPLVLGTTTTSGTLEMEGELTRSVAATAVAGTGSITWGGTTGGGGFAASTGKLVVALGGIDSPTALTWGSGGFVGTGGAQSLVLNSTTALGEVELRNAIDLNNGTRTITVNDNTTTFTDFATITGVISNSTGTGNLVKAGGGMLQLLGANTYNGSTTVLGGTLVVTSLGNSATGGATSVGSATGANSFAQAVILGNATTTGGTLVYVGPGETSDRYIHFDGTTAGPTIVADGSGPLILTNVLNNTAVTPTGAKTLTLRGANNFGNMITSNLANDGGGGVLSVAHDSGGTWILTGNNSYTGGTSVTAGALGIGHNSAFGGVGTLTISNGSVFAHGGDRVISNPITQSATSGTGATFFGDYSITLAGPWADPSTTSSSRFIRNNIVTGKTLTIGTYTVGAALTSSTGVTFDGSGDTIITGPITNFSDATNGLNFGVFYAGTGSLTLGNSGNAYTGATTITSGTIRLGAGEVIPNGAVNPANNRVVINPAVGVSATLDLNGNTETINGLTANGAGNIFIDNTSASPASLTFGANDQAVLFGGGLGNYTIQNSGGGALSITKTGTTAMTIATGATLTYSGSTNVTGGSLTIASPLTATSSLSVTGSGSILALTGGLSNPAAITSVTVGDGATLTLLDGMGSQMNNLTALTLGSSGGTMSTLNLNVGDLTTAGDGLQTDTLSLKTGGTLNLFSGNKVTFNLTDAGLSANQTYTLVSVVDGGLVLGNLTATDYILGGTPGGFTSITLNRTDTAITITTGDLIVGSSYWRGLTNTTWNGAANNWSTDKAGTTPAASIPGQGTDVVFAANGIASGSLTTTLEQNFKINSLTFEAGSPTPSSVTINPGTVSTNRLEIAPQSSAVGLAITAGGPATVNIATALKLGKDQTWNVADTGSTLTLGSLLGTADVTKTGSGRVILSAAADSTFNTAQTSDFTINGGTLEIQAANSLGATVSDNAATVTVNSTGAFYFNNATSGVVNNNLTLGGGTLSAGGNNHTYSGTVAVTADSTIMLRENNSTDPAAAARSISLSGVVSGTGALTIDGNNAVSGGNQLAGTLTLNQNNSGWSGAVNVLRGSILAQNANALGTGPISFEFGKIEWEGAGGTTYSMNRPITIARAGGNAVGEWNIDRTSGTGTFAVSNAGTVTLGGAGGSGEIRIFLADTAVTEAHFTGDVILANNGIISVRDNATSRATISGVISETGGARTLAVNDLSVWGGTGAILRLTGLNTFTGNLSVGAGILEFDTVTNSGGAASSLGQGSAISMAGGTLSFIGNTSQSTNRPISTTGSIGLSANGTGGAVISYAGAITQATNNSLTLGGTGAGELSGGFTQVGDAADLTVSGGTWTHLTATSRVGDDATVTGAGTTLNLNSGLLQVRDDFTVTTNAALNLNGTGVLSFNIATLSANSSLRAVTGGIINLLANNAIVLTEFDELRIGVDGAGIGTFNMGGFNQSVNALVLGNRQADREGYVTGPGLMTITGNFDVYEGTISANLASTGSTALEKFGMDMVTFTGDNSGLASTGATIVYDGTLNLDYTLSNTTKIRAASALDMRSGTLLVTGNASAATAQTVASLTLGNGGFATIQVNAGAGQEAVLNLGAITRAINAQDGTIRFVLPTGVQSATNGITTTTGLTNGILGGYASVDDGTGTWFATKSGNNIVALLSTAKNAVGTWVAGDHITDETSGFAGVLSGNSINSLRFNAATGSDLQVATTGVLGIASGGILVTDNVGGTSGIFGGTLVSGAMATNVPELIITQDSTQVFELNSEVRINHAITKGGPGTMRLSGNNTYTGYTEIQKGLLQVSGGNAIGDTSLVTLSSNTNSTLQLLSNETIGRLQGGQRQDGGDYGTVNIGAHTLTINQSASTTYSGVFTGSGTIVIGSGTGNLNIAGASSTGFTGTVVVNSGLFQLSGAAARVNAATSFTINNGGNFLLDNNDDNSPNDRISDTASFTLNSAAGFFSGQTIIRGLAIRSDNDGNESETIGALTFNSGANYSSLEATHSTGASALHAIIAADWSRLNSATINVRGRSLGGASGANRTQFKILDGATETAFLASSNLVGAGQATGASNKGVSIVPWAIGETTSAALTDANMGNTFVSYVDNRGFVPLDLTNEYALFAAAGTQDNVRENLTADATGLNGKTINSLVVNNPAVANANFTGSGSGQTLTNTSGAFLFTVTGGAASTAYNTVLGGFDGGVQVGGSEYIFHTVNPSSAATTSTLNVTVSSPLVSAADITKSGRGTLILTGTNTAGGGVRKTTLNEGILEISDLDNIGGDSGGLVFAGGTLRLSTSYSGDDLSLRSISLLTGGGTIDTNGASLALAGSAGSGVGGLTKAGPGTLTLNAAATYQGPTTVSAGTLAIGANNATGNGGDLTISGGATLDLGANSILARQVTTAGASPIISGTGTITASSGFVFNHTGDTTIGVVLASSGGVLKGQANILTFSAANSFSGPVEVQAGTLSFNSIANVGGGASALGAPTTALAGMIRMGLTTTATTLNYTGTGHSSNRIIAMQGTTGGVTLDADGSGALALGQVQITTPGNKTLTLRGSSLPSVVNQVGRIDEFGLGVLTLNKADANTWLLGAINAYTGATNIDEGTIMLGANDALPTTTTVRLGTGATAGTLDLNEFNQTITSLTSTTNSGTATNNIIIDAGKTLTVTGAVTLGANAATSTTLITGSGGGSFVNNNDGGTFQVGGGTGGTNINAAVVDFSGFGSFTANLGAAGTFRVGDNNTNSSGVAGANTILTLAATQNLIAAGTLNIGQGTGQASTPALRLGSGTNTIRADIVNIGGNTTRSGGRLDFAGASGSVNIRAFDGTSRATVNMVNGSISTAANQTSDFLMAGHSADLLVSTLTMAARSANSGSVTSTLTFDTGTADITTLNMASRTGAGTGGATATATFGGGTATIGTLGMAVNTSAGGAVTADFNITGGAVTIGTGSGTAISMANAGTGRTVTSTLDITGGSLTVTGNIVRTGGVGTENATITLDGGSLNMSGFSIGASGTVITLAAQSGTLTNLAELNGGGQLTKTTTGVLTLGNGNTYTGGTAINAGILVASNTLGSATGAGTVSVNGTGTLAGTGIVTGPVSLNGGFIAPGGYNPGSSEAGDDSLIGQITVASVSILSGGTLQLQLGGFTAFDPEAMAILQNDPGNFSAPSSWTDYQAGTTQHDQLLITNVGAPNLENMTVEVLPTFLNGFTPTYGHVFQILDWTSLGTQNITGNVNWNLPTLSGYSWNTSLFASHGVIAVVPEPSRLLLLFLGLFGLTFRRRRAGKSAK